MSKIISDQIHDIEALVDKTTIVPLEIRMELLKIKILDDIGQSLWRIASSLEAQEK